jgi:hypothetical protein
MSAPKMIHKTLFTLTLLALPLAAQQKVELDKLVKVKEWGYQIQPIKGWNAMPADQEDRWAVGRWKQDLEQFRQRGNIEAYNSGSFCELKIMRMEPKVETPTGGENTPAVTLPASWDKKLNPKNIEDWIEGQYEGASKRWTRTPLKGGKMQGDLLEFGSSASHVTVGLFRHLGVEWAVVYESFEESYRKTWRDIYIKSVLTFQVTEKVDPKVIEASRKDINKLEGEEKRAALKASIAGKPGWYTVDTKYYVFISNADRAFVEKLAKELETVREKVYKPNFPPRNEKIPLNPVRIFATQSEYHQFGGPGGSAGYFSPTKGELVLFEKFDDQSGNKSRDDCRSVMFHEGFHQYIHFAVGDVSPHSWFNEGHGDYFAGLVVQGNAISKVNTFKWRVDYLKQHLGGKNDLIPLRSLLRYPQREYYANAGLKYSQGWAVIYYLRNVSKNKAHKQALDTYFSYLADNVTAFRSKKKAEEGDDDKPRGESVPGIPGVRFVDFEDAEKVEQILSEAVDKAFASIDLEELDKELRAWVEKL